MKLPSPLFVSGSAKFCVPLRSSTRGERGRSCRTLPNSALQPSQPSCFAAAAADGACRAPIVPWIYGSSFQWRAVAGQTNQVFARVPMQFLLVGVSMRKGGFRRSNNCTSLRFAACATCLGSSLCVAQSPARACFPVIE